MEETLEIKDEGWITVDGEELKIEAYSHCCCPVYFSKESVKKIQDFLKAHFEKETI